MKIYYGINDGRLKIKPRCVAVGIFDGVHRGHQKILGRVLSDADRLGMNAAVITFDPHPSTVLGPKKSVPFLMSLPHRLNFFGAMGFSEAIVISFDKKFSTISRETFLRDCLIDKLGMKTISVGHDFRFGYQARGDTEFLSKEARKQGFKLHVAKPLKRNGIIISSTRIRHLIEKGKLAKAAQMLGRPVSVYGTVVRGRGRGRGLGFPTANLNPHHETLPPGGVYAAWGRFCGTKIKGVIHIGERPTFKDREKALEIHFLDFKEKIYGKEMELFFLKRLRGTRRFKNPKELQRAIRKDIRKALRIFG